MAIVFGLLALAANNSVLSTVLWPGILLIAVLSLAPAHFFGPNSGFAAIVALLLIFVGLLARRDEEPASQIAPLSVFLVIAVGQAVIVGLPIAGVLPDHSLVQVVIPGHLMWHHVIAHVAVQAVYLMSFVVGRILRKRHTSLSTDVDEAVRTAAKQRALASEARQEYQSALASAREGIFSGRTVGRYQVGTLRTRDETSEVYDAVDTREGTEVTVRVLAGQNIALERGLASDTAIIANNGGAGSSAGLVVSGLGTPLPVVVTVRENGLTLDELVAEEGPLPVEQLSILAAEVAAALGEIHATESIHLEVSPRNIRFADGKWTLSSAGLGGPPMTSDLAYVAPERLGAPFVDQRADIYGLCAAVYYGLTGAAPFSDLDIVTLQNDRGLPRDPGGTESLRAALRVGLAIEPDDRFANIEATAAALCATLEGEPLTEFVRRARSLDENITWHELPLERLRGLITEQTVTEMIPIDNSAEVPRSLWIEAYSDKMRLTTYGLTGICVGGAALFALVIREQVALIAGLVSLAGITAATWLYRSRFGRTGAVWPWIVCALFSAGAAYAIGFNSAFASFLAVFLFSSGLFQAGYGADTFGNRGGVVLAACGGIAAGITGVLLGFIPDASNVKVFQPGAPLGETILLHFNLIVIYLTAFAIGRAIDRRYERLANKARRAAEEAAAQSVMLSDARAEIERLLTTKSVGLFSSLRIGNYLVGRLLGRGGMGEVYAARHAETGVRAALKVLRFDRVSEPGHLRLFLREAETLSKISSPHVAGILEVGDFEDGLPFIAMEFIAGDVLAELLTKKGKLSLEMARAMVADIGAGLAAVHRAYIVHRDIKPANIILTRANPDSNWKLVDFGVASVGLDPDSRRMILGTPLYMSPEQARGGEIDSRSDLYSLCLVIYRALTGVPAFEGDKPSDIAKIQRDVGIVNPTDHAPIALDVELALRIGLARDPANRFATAEALRDAFEDAFAKRLDPEVRRAGRELLVREPWKSSES